MKKTVFIIPIIILLAFSYAHAQITPIEQRLSDYKSGDYVKTPSIVNFDGTWLWQEGNRSFKLVLVKKIKIGDGRKDHPFFVDMVLGGCVYTENGKQIINTLSTIESDHDLTGFVIKENLLDLLVIIPDSPFRYEFREGGPHAAVRFNPDNKTLTWRLTDVAGDKKKRIYSIPRNMVLKKVE